MLLLPKGILEFCQPYRFVSCHSSSMSNIAGKRIEGVPSSVKGSTPSKTEVMMAVGVPVMFETCDLSNPHIPIAAFNAVLLAATSVKSVQFAVSSSNKVYVRLFEIGDAGGPS